MSGDKIPGFELLRMLGRGGMGSVYLARHEASGKTVALKVSRGNLGEQGVARLRREAELLARIQDPALPGFVDAQEVGHGNFLLAMAFVPGDPLQAYVATDAEPSERLEILRRALPGIARGLLALHQAGIVHRDLKPANVILTAQGAVVVDLGLARGPDVATLTRTGAAVGTPEYLPPEQITGELAGPPADLYQVGLIARDLLLGSRRTPGKDMIQDAMRRAVALPEDPRSQAPWVPTPVAEWILACLHPSPAGRPDTAEHLQRAVALCRQELTPRGAASPGSRAPDLARHRGAPAGGGGAEALRDPGVADRGRGRGGGRPPRP